MQSKRTFIVYSDPGHAWARVSFHTLRELGIEDKISPYSYQRNGFAFLEEDLDLGVLITALRARGIEPRFIEKNRPQGYSKIRSYLCYTPHVLKNYFEQKSALRAVQVSEYSLRGALC
jgi:hypothetical protein